MGNDTRRIELRIAKIEKMLVATLAAMQGQEAGARHLGPSDHVVGRQTGDDGRRHLARALLQAPAQRHRHVSLVVGVLGAVQGGLGAGGSAGTGTPAFTLRTSSCWRMNS